MDTIFAKVAGLGVHQKFITVGIRCRLETGKLFAEVRTFGTMTRDLMALADYLEALGVTHVAMESTGVLWKPVWNILESRRFTLFLVNPRQVKQVPGRKSDVSDAEWIAQLWNEHITFFLIVHIFMYQLYKVAHDSHIGILYRHCLCRSGQELYCRVCQCWRGGFSGGRRYW